MVNKRQGYVERSVTPWPVNRPPSVDTQIAAGKCRTDLTADNVNTGLHAKTNKSDFVTDADKIQTTQDYIAQERAVALSYNGIAHLVMMLSPIDLEEFAVGFSFSEGIIDKRSDLYAIEFSSHAMGLEIAMTISNQCFMRLKDRRRVLVGKTSCGICGAQSLEYLQTITTTVNKQLVISHMAIDHAVSDLHRHQPLQKLTGAVHAAAWCDKDGNIVHTFEDVGRHNALDKLIGALLNTQTLDQDGFVVISSRASFEMVQKTAKASIAILVAVSAPTSLAIDVAEQSQLTLVAFSREGRHVVYSHEQRIQNITINEE